MLRLSWDNVHSVLCLGSHADDIEIGCGGTLLRLLAAQPRLQVCWVVLSAAGVRRAEAEESARRFLAHAVDPQVIVRDFRDRFFPYQGEAIKEFLHELSASVAPDVIFTHRLADRHQDHRHVAEWTWNAFRDHLILEYEIAKYEGDLGQPNVFVPLDEAICRQKIDLLSRSFPSQQSKPWYTPDTFWALLRLRGLECHSPSRFAEAFHAAKIVL